MKIDLSDLDSTLAAHNQPSDRTSESGRNDSFAERRRWSLRESAIERQRLLQERDAARGYSINVKQVVLAFAVEFFIIGLILVGQYLIAEEAAKEKVFSILLFPIGLAVVELARVPLAVAVRTQNSWSVKFFASLGVLSAVVVTSFSLSTIAYQTFDPRLAAANEKKDVLHSLMAVRNILRNEQGEAKQVAALKVKARDNAGERYKDLQSQISKISTIRGETCSTTTNQDGSTNRQCSSTNLANAAQLKTLQGQLANAKNELDAAEADVKQSQASHAKIDVSSIGQKITQAESDYRAAVARSQLHSYTSMIKGKTPSDVTEAEVKELESYLIFIPSIAAALASTLLAITAVRRIKQPAPPTAIPEEAAAYLFGPLLTAIQTEAKIAVATAINSHARATAPPETKTVEPS